MKFDVRGANVRKFEVFNDEKSALDKLKVEEKQTIMVCYVRSGIKSRNMVPYLSLLPVANLSLAKRMDQAKYSIHRQKVDNAKPMIDDNPPRVHMHLNIKLKKLQSEAERLATIERNNRILLQKVSHIMQNGGVVYEDKEHFHMKSLNIIKRQRELLRITYENLAILRRLTTKDPHYKCKKWLLQWQVNQQYLMNICKYSHPWRTEQSPYKQYAERQSAANKRTHKEVQKMINSSFSPRPLSTTAGGDHIASSKKSSAKPAGAHSREALENRTTVSPKSPKPDRVRFSDIDPPESKPSKKAITRRAYTPMTSAAKPASFSFAKTTRAKQKDVKSRLSAPVRPNSQ